jgi:pyruvate kinase
MDPDYEASELRCGTTWPTMANDVSVGEMVLFADGALGGTVEAVRFPPGAPAEVDIRITIGGTLGSHKGINLPETDIQAPALTDKDRADLAVGVSAGVDYVALSFVRHAADCIELRALLTELDAGEMPVIAKIEKPEALAGIDAILENVQGIMVARGDLGVEIPYEQVPSAQKTLIQAANRVGALVITATQMLDSMERNPRPTRAEITDVANAILDGTDAVMLSGETSVGRYPIEAVEAMSRIASEVEDSPWFQRPAIDGLPHASTAEGTVLRAASFAVREGDRALVVFTWSGNTAIKASKSRPKRGVYAITHDQKVADRLSLAWGVNALMIPMIRGTDDLITEGEKALLDSGWLNFGEEVVLLAGRVPMRGATNMMKIEIIDGRATI